MPLILTLHDERHIVSHQQDKNGKPEIVVEPAKHAASATTDFNIRELFVKAVVTVHRHYTEGMTYFNEYSRETDVASDENDVFAGFMAHIINHLAPIKPFPQNRQFDDMVKNQLAYYAENIETVWQRYDALAA